MKTSNIKKLRLIANAIRQDIISMIAEAGSGHPGGSLGMTDIFTVLYFNILKYNPKNPNWGGRDYLILSNGHICPAMYASMAHAGFFPKKELMTLRKIGSRLQGHPERTKLPGLETTSGPLGCGLSQACGMALVLRLEKKKNHVYCLMSDGEQDEGNSWEALMTASKYNLTNITAIIDRNKIQLSGKTHEIMPLGSLKSKYESFGWHVLEIDGNDIKQIIHALTKTRNIKDKPICIIANTILGKGVSFMENDYNWHGKAPSIHEAEVALNELKQTRKKRK